MVTKAVLCVLFLVGCTKALSIQGDLCNLEVCLDNSTQHCMSDGSIATGCLELQNAICVRGLTEILDLDICLSLLNCPSVPTCTIDLLVELDLDLLPNLLPHCLSNGTRVYGCLDLTRALCLGGGQLIEVDLDSCPPSEINNSSTSGATIAELAEIMAEFLPAGVLNIVNGFGFESTDALKRRPNLV